jgi:hypothetical protein
MCRCCRRTGEWSLAAKVQLEDATGRLDALLLGRHAHALLGVAPFDPAASPGQVAALTRALALLGHMDLGGVGSDGEGCSWLEVVLSSAHSTRAATAAREATALAGGIHGGSDANFIETVCGLGGTALSDVEARVLSDPRGCVYMLHDTFLVSA